MEYVVGLDLGQAQDYSALAVVERSEKAASGGLADPWRAPKVGHYAVRHLRRWPLGTPYPAIVREVSALLERPPLPGCLLAVDATGVGRAVVDLFRQAGLPARLVPITITAGHQASRDGGGWRVAKKHLASVLQVLLQQQRLKVAALPEREVLLGEMRAFRVKLSATGNETFEAWRERDHDDLVLAVALACWLAERGRSGPALRVVQYSTAQRQPALRVVTCSREELASLPPGQRRCLLVSVTDPGRPPPSPPDDVQPADTLALEFADLDPATDEMIWSAPVAPYGLPADELIMKREHGKRLWSHLLRKRDPAAAVWIVQDEGDRRALSLAYALCDALRLPRQDTICQACDQDWVASGEDVPPNRTVYDVAKASRAMVV